MARMQPIVLLALCALVANGLDITIDCGADSCVSSTAFHTTVGTTTANNQAFTLVNGVSNSINIATSASHPVHFKTNFVIGTAPSATNDLTAGQYGFPAASLQGMSSATAVNWVVSGLPATGTVTIYYQCGNHPDMRGTITLDSGVSTSPAAGSPSPTPSPASGGAVSPSPSPATGTSNVRLLTVNTSATSKTKAIRIKNFGTADQSLATWQVCQSTGAGSTATCATIVCEVATIKAGAQTSCDLNVAPSTGTSGSVWIKKDATIGTAAASFVQWGAGSLEGSVGSVSAGVWSAATDFVSLTGLIYNAKPTVFGPSAWVAGMPTITSSTTTTSALVAAGDSTTIVVDHAIAVSGPVTTDVGGKLTVSGPVTASGDITVNTGSTLEIKSGGSVTGTAGARVEGTLSVASGTTGITVSGAAVISGTAVVTVASGGTFNEGDTVTLITYGSHSGDFTGVTVNRAKRDIEGRATAATTASVSCGSTSCVATGSNPPSAASTSTDTPVPEAIRLGVGIGIGLGVPVLLALIALLYCCCCRKAAAPKAPGAAPANAAAAPNKGTQTGTYSNYENSGASGYGTYDSAAEGTSGYGDEESYA